MTVDCSWRAICTGRCALLPQSGQHNFSQQYISARSRNRFGTQSSPYARACTVGVKRSCFRIRREWKIYAARLLQTPPSQFYILNQRYDGSRRCRHSWTLAQVSFVVGRCIYVSTQPCAAHREQKTLRLSECRVRCNDRCNNNSAQTQHMCSGAESHTNRIYAHLLFSIHFLICIPLAAAARFCTQVSFLASNHLR